ncbi:hypothetical protein, conserved [Eimeria praecox]|uniref:Uncharacterized protein n=1 Tax=Eimeria praecox TaxID=51316 RepID=U6G5M1_9EIME|nr:hypothetical protein, conserved [Eimeria praecox]
MDNDFWDLDGEAKAVIAFAPFMAGENIFFEGAAHLRPQTVPFALEQAEDFSIDRSGVPKAWAAYLREQVTDGAVPEEQEPSEGPIDLGWLSEFSIDGDVAEGWLSEFSIDGDVAEGSDPARLRISSADAMKVARGISERYFGAAPVEEQKQSPEALANAHFSRLIGRLGSGLVTVVTEANRLPKMKFDARSRNLRSELALLEIGNAVERLKEQQSEALKDVNEARAKLENGDDDGQAEAQAEEAILTYKSLLRSEKHLMMALVELASRWKDETTKVLTNIASVLTSSAMEDLEQISTFEASHEYCFCSYFLGHGGP